MASTFGMGAYTLAEAGRLLNVHPSTVRRWLFGYSYDHHGPLTHQRPLWTPQYGDDQEIPLLGFRDLLEARIVRGLREQGLRLQVIRSCLQIAREIVEDDHPFSTRRFRTDGKTLFVEKDGALIDLKLRQHVFKKVIEPSFTDLEYDADAASRWWLNPAKKTILIDPRRAFGQPIAAESGVPTASLAQAVLAEGSVKRAAYLFDVELAIVRDAVAFERQGAMKLAA